MIGLIFLDLEQHVLYDIKTVIQNKFTHKPNSHLGYKIELEKNF